MLRVRAPTSEQRDAVRARIVLLVDVSDNMLREASETRHAGFKRVACDLYEEEAKRLDGTIFHRVYRMMLTHSD
jgi:hypothetical protein